MNNKLFLIALVIIALLSSVAVANETTEASVEVASVDGVLTNRWAVQLHVQPLTSLIAEVGGWHALAERVVQTLNSAPGQALSARLVGMVGQLEDTFVMEFPEALSVPGVAETVQRVLSEHPQVVWFERQVERIRYKRMSVPPSDPAYKYQWHLHGSSYSIAATDLWQRGITGSGVQIAIVDDGLQHTNPDLSTNYDADGSFDFNYHNSSPDPNSRDHHGTESAGVAGAGQNSICGVGVAPEVKLAGVRLLAKSTSDADEAAALSYKPQLNMIYSNSWGPSDSGSVVEGPGTLLQRAFEQVVSQGRGGLGGVYVWAGGNGRSAGDNCNCDGYVNSVYTIPIGAYTDSGNQAYYSESCSALFASMPSSGGSKGITTTDLTSTSGDCTSSFGGTSAAAPMAAGAVALILQARPDLTWRDVQGVIVYGATPVLASDSQSTQAGLSFSHAFGFGRMILPKLLETAERWELMPASQVFSLPLADLKNKQFTQNKPLNFEFTFEHDITVEQVAVTLQITIPRGSLDLQLVSPFGTTSHLMVPRSRDRGTNWSWTFSTVASWGESAQGTWLLRFGTSSNTGTVTSAVVTVYGH